MGIFVKGNTIESYSKGNTSPTISNAPAEGWFKNLSVNTFLNKRNMKIARFVRGRLDVIQNILKTIRLIPKGQKS